MKGPLHDMSKKNNVHPDHYKTGGREPQGQGVAHEVEQQNYGKTEAAEKRDQSLAKPQPAGKKRAKK